MRVAVAKGLSKEEISKLQQYMRKLFRSDGLEVRSRQKATDSAEVYLRDDFLGLVSKDIEDGEICYQFNMSILDYDLDES
jgi:hypothetical protein